MFYKLTKNTIDMRWGLLLVVASLVAGGCATSRDVTTSEYDDVYFSSSDYIKETPISESAGRATMDERDLYEASRNGDLVDIYDEDDFHYSRRLRRFNQPHSNSWRYYDPFFANDLYYVINTPAWNRWNNFGWYNWNRPRFGTSIALGFGNPFMGFNSWNYFNPWARTFYGADPFFGYDPFFGFGGFNRFGYNAGFWDGYAFGWNGLPPGVWANTPAWQRYNYTRRVNTTSLATQTGYGNNRLNNQRTGRPSTTNSGTITSSRRPNAYLTPKTDAEKSARADQDFRRRVNAVSRMNSSSRRSGTEVSTRDRSNPRVYRRPNSSVDRNSRSYDTRRRTYDSRRSSNSEINRRSTPSRRPSPSYDRSNTRRQPSYTPRSRPSTSSPSYRRPSSPSSRPSPSSRRPQ